MRETQVAAPRPGPRDEDIGLRGFLTTTPPLGGRLKVRIEDFWVDEFGPEPPEDPRGRHVAARVRLSNWETHAFVRAASERLRRSRNTIQFSGTKDRRGVTERWFTFEASPEDVAALSDIGGVEVLRLHRTGRALDLGEHAGNRFRITLRDVAQDEGEAGRAVQDTWSQVQEAGGVPNAFGPQRFGAQRATTHKVGERIVQGDFLGAVLTYLCEPGSEDDPETVRAREQLRATLDWKAALASFQGDSSFERALLHRMIETNRPIDALLALPKTLQRMFVGAYQAWMFNEILSRRLEEGLRLDRPEVGDLVAPVDEGRVLDEWVPVTEANRSRVADEVRKGRGRLTGLLPGTEAPLAAGAMGRIEASVLKLHDVLARDFLIPEQLEWSSKGTRRALLLPLKAFGFQVLPDDLHPGCVKVEIGFELPPGAYATSVLREFMKSGRLKDYG